jgi:ribosome-binding ATPase YchF (GTP1/OBG family)
VPVCAKLEAEIAELDEADRGEMLAGAGLTEPTVDDMQRATAHVQDTRALLNEQLRMAFGAASLPEDVRPSALRG